MVTGNTVFVAHAEAFLKAISPEQTFNMKNAEQNYDFDLLDLVVVEENLNKSWPINLFKAMSSYPR